MAVNKNIIDIVSVERTAEILAGRQFANPRGPVTEEEAMKEIAGAMFKSVKSPGFTFFKQAPAKVNSEQPTQDVTNKNTPKPQSGGG